MLLPTSKILVQQSLINIIHCTCENWHYTWWWPLFQLSSVALQTGLDLFHKAKHILLVFLSN